MEIHTNQLDSTQSRGSLSTGAAAESAKTNLSSLFFSAAGMRSPGRYSSEPSMTPPSAACAGDRRQPQGPSHPSNTRRSPCPGSSASTKPSTGPGGEHSRPQTQSLASLLTQVPARRSHQKGPHYDSGASDDRSMAEPRMLRLEMDASVASSQRDLVDSPLRHKGEVSQRQELGVVQAKDRLGCTNGLSPEDESEVDEEQSTAILAVCRHGDTLGLAAYREVDNVIDIQETHAFQSDMVDTLEGIKLLVRPWLILTDLNMTNHTALFDMLVAPLLEGGDEIECKLLKRSCWDYQGAVRRICANLKVRSLERQHQVATEGRNNAERAAVWGKGSSDGATRRGGGDPFQDAFNRLACVIDFQAQQQARALGALMSYLQSKVFTLEGSGTVTVATVRQLDNSRSMFIDAMALRSLGIMAEEFHPNVLSGKGRSKEGFSVFGLFDRTRTASGRRCLKEWMLKPLYDIGDINARQDGVEVLMQAENAEICKRLRSQLGKSHDMARILLRIKKARTKREGGGTGAYGREVVSTFMDWCKLIQSIESTLDIRDSLMVLKTRAEALTAVGSGVAEMDGYHSQAFLARLVDDIDTVVLRCCLDGLSDVIDSTASAEDREVVIRIGFDEDLDRKRDLLAELPDILRAIVLEENPVLDELSVEYVPQIGFLTILDKRFGDLAPPSFIFAFAQARGHPPAGDTVYYKNPRMYEMDDGIGDIQAKITDDQARILRHASATFSSLLEQEAVLHAAAAATAELDAAMSLASVASDFGFVRPEVVQDNVIIIKNGRHPLQASSWRQHAKPDTLKAQELTVERFIPNDTYIADGSRVALITGANCSGKSVYVKQVGVTVFLSHVGSFVPAEKAIIGLTDRIFTRISTVETSSLPQSTFTIDVAHMVRGGTERSLLLIDEFGKGTAPADGIGLVAALVRHLSQTRRKCLFTLHFHEIFSQGLVKIHSPNDMRTELSDVSVFRMDVYAPLPAKARPQLDEVMVENGTAVETNKRSVDDEDWVAARPTPLFKLVPGVTSTSYGIACAEFAGIPPDVLDRAREVVRLEDKGWPIQPRSAGNRERGRVTAASSQVQNALKLFLTPPGGSSWQHAPDSLVDSLLAAADCLGGFTADGGLH
ncbi:unnamed protein product [Ascophyllum nodosum]